MRTYIFGFLAVVVLAIGNEAGQAWHIYQSVAYYDIFMHLLGGFAIGLSVAAAVELHGGMIRHKLWFILGTVLLAGLAWEAFEAYYDIAGAPVGTHAYWIDTVKDLIDDCVGGFLASAVETRRLRQTGAS